MYILSVPVHRAVGDVMHRFHAAPVTVVFVVELLTTPNAANDAVVRNIFARGLDPMVPMRSLNSHGAAFACYRGALRQVGRSYRPLLTILLTNVQRSTRL